MREVSLLWIALAAAVPVALGAVDAATGELTDLPVPYVDGGSEAFKGHVKDDRKAKRR